MAYIWDSIHHAPLWEPPPVTCAQCIHLQRWGGRRWCARWRRFVPDEFSGAGCSGLLEIDVPI